MKFAKFSKGLLLFTILFLSSICAGSVPLRTKGHTVTLRSIQPGPTPFISFVFLTPRPVVCRSRAYNSRSRQSAGPSLDRFRRAIQKITC